MKLYIVTEATAKTGFGHLTRCTALYQAFLPMNIKLHFIVDADDSSRELLQELPHTILNWQLNTKQLLDNISKEDVLIIDSYIAAPHVYTKVCEKAKLAVYIDDNNRINYPKGIIVNGTIFAEDLQYRKNLSTEYLLGSKFTPIRKEFWNVETKTINREIISMMITFGGDDFRKLTEPVLTFLQNEFPEIHKYVVVGNAFSNKARLMEKSDHSTELLTNLCAEDMLQVMLKSDIAISAAGQTLNELARVGVPTIAVQVVENQRGNVHGFVKSGFIEYAGRWDDKKLSLKIKKSINNIYSYEVRSEKNKIGRSIIDGQGARRIVQAILEKIS